ncbi:hypothetical protein JCM14720_03560 [Calditerricola yamamurae]
MEELMKDYELYLRERGRACVWHSLFYDNFILVAVRGLFFEHGRVIGQIS